MKSLKIIECPRDAMQGWTTRIPTPKKIEYINQLLKVGFDTLDCVSFVSHKLIPQMADSEEVSEKIDNTRSQSKLLAIVANRRGAEDAIMHSKIYYLGYPYAVSPTFQHRNANKTLEESLEDVKYMYDLCQANNRELVIYLSMAFGNPYGDAWSEKIVAGAAEQVAKIGVHTISLADTVGLATAKEIEKLIREIVRLFPDNEIGAHLHSRLEHWKDKLRAAHDNGCFRFDGAINGYGGCPMAEDELVGNMNTGLMVRYFMEKGYQQNINLEELRKAEHMAASVFL